MRTILQGGLRRGGLTPAGGAPRMPATVEDVIGRGRECGITYRKARGAKNLHGGVQRKNAERQETRSLPCNVAVRTTSGLYSTKYYSRRMGAAAAGVQVFTIAAALLVRGNTASASSSSAAVQRQTATRKAVRRTVYI